MRISKFELSLVALAMLIGAFHVLSFGFCLQDDTYIGLRYSRNLTEGHGLVFNPGEYVEGYTNFSWVMLSTIPFLLNFDAVMYVRMISILSAVLAILMVGMMANIVSNGRKGAAFSASLIFASLPFAMAEAAMGLETLFFTAVVVAALSRFILEREDGKRNGYGSGLLLALAALTRPEAIGIAVILVVFDILKLRKQADNSELKKQMRIRWICFALPVLSHLVFRWFYYGDIVPNTFHAKVGGGLHAISRGLHSTGQFIKDAAPLLVSAILALVTAKTLKRLKFNLGLLICCITMLCYMLYVLYVGGDFRPTNRFFIFPAAMLVVICGSILPSLMEGIKKRKVYWSVLVLVALFVSFSSSYSAEAVREFARWRRSLLLTHIAAGEWLRSEYPSDTWLATGNVGVIPYVSGLLTIDMHGLCDRHIASRSIPGMGQGVPGHEKGDGLYILSRHPKIILFMLSRFSDHPLTMEEVESKLFGISECELWGNSYFHDNYTLVSSPLRNIYFNFFERK